MLYIKLSNLKAKLVIGTSILIQASSFSIIAYCDSTSKKAHAHGAAQLTLAIEDRTSGSVDFDVPADAIYGFEHEAKSEKDRIAQTKGLKKLEQMAAQIIVFDSKLNCKISNIKVAIETEEKSEKPNDKVDHKGPDHHDHQGHHADVNASYTFTCGMPIAGTKVRTGLLDEFKEIQKIDFNILSGNNQTSRTITNSKDHVSIP